MRFFIIFLITMLVLAFYTVLCVVRLVPSYAFAGSILSVLVIVFIIRMQIFSRRSENPSPVAKFAVWVSSIGLGWWSSFILFCLLIDGINFILLLAQLGGVDVAASFDKTHWTQEGLRAALAASALTSALGLMQAMRGPVVRRVRVPIAALPSALVGLRIAQLSDLHIGPIIRETYISDVVRKTLALAPELIAITGDIADGSPEMLRKHSAPLAELRAPLGVYFITGNHEYYSGALAWIEEAKRLGMIPLINENRVLEYGGATLMIAGVTDIAAHNFIPEHRSDPFRAVTSQMQCDLRVLLAHQPESSSEAQQAGFDLQLSGHTHGGQYFPFNVVVRTVKRFAKGLYRYKTLWVHVNPGTGFWGAANRFGVPAEITLLELARAD